MFLSINPKRVIVLLATVSVFIVATRAASPTQLEQWAQLYHLDQNTVSQEYRKLLGSDYDEFVRARMYFEQNKAFELLAYAVAEVKEDYRLKLVHSLLDVPNYSPPVVAVVLETFERMYADPELQAFTGYMTTALARWLDLADPKLAFSARPEVSRKTYAAFLLQAKQKANAMKANSGK